MFSLCFMENNFQEKKNNIGAKIGERAPNIGRNMLVFYQK